MGDNEPLYDRDAGPWADEPDHVIFRAGVFPCHIRRNITLGNLCGYVGVPRGHPYYGTDRASAEIDTLIVHGGVTWVGALPWEYGVAGEDRWWWIGFDCGHWMDMTPAWPDSPSSTLGGYRDMAYVRGECEALARQLALLTG